MPRDPSLPNTQLLQAPDAASDAATLEQPVSPELVKRLDQWVDDDPTVVDRPPKRGD